MLFHECNLILEAALMLHITLMAFPCQYHYKYLVIIIQSDLNCNKHVVQKVSKARFQWD